MTTVDRLYNEAMELSEEEQWELMRRLAEGGPPITGPASEDEWERRVRGARDGTAATSSVSDLEATYETMKRRKRDSAIS